MKANRSLVYLLLFQRDKVTNALAEVSGERGDEFLKKLVQVSFDIPDVPETRLHKVLIDGLNEIFSQSFLLKAMWTDWLSTQAPTFMPCVFVVFTSAR